MKKLKVTLTFGCGDQNESHSTDFDVEDGFDLKRAKSLSTGMLHECHTALLSATYRAAIPEFRNFIDQMNWSGPASGIFDLTRWSAHRNTAQAWWQIQNAFTESAHILARARAYDDIGNAQSDDDLRLYIHFMKIQTFNAAAHLICKVEDWFLLLLFVNSGASLIPSIDVHDPDWRKSINRSDVRIGLRQRKSEGASPSNPYLDSLSDEDYRTIRRVFTRLGRALAVRSIRKYRNEIAHRGLPAVDVPAFSPDFAFPMKNGRVVQFGISGGARVEYKFLDLYQHAVDALKHMEHQLLQLKQIPVLMPR